MKGLRLFSILLSNLFILLLCSDAQGKAFKDDEPVLRRVKRAAPSAPTALPHDHVGMDNVTSKWTKSTSIDVKQVLVKIYEENEPMRTETINKDTEFLNLTGTKPGFNNEFEDIEDFEDIPRFPDDVSISERSGFPTTDKQFKECSTRKCKPWTECRSLVELRNQIVKNVRASTHLIQTLRNFQCDYNRTSHRPYYCCPDEEEEVSEVELSDFEIIKNHPNRRLIPSGQGYCGYMDYNPSSVSAPLNKAGLEEIGWTAFITYNGKPFCSGTLINDRYILTAAHCLRHVLKHVDEIEITLGDYDVYEERDCFLQRNGRKHCIKTELVGVDEIHSHSDYSVESGLNDIALMRLNRKIEYSNIRPVCLPFDDEVTISKEITYDIYGHGVSKKGKFENRFTFKNRMTLVNTDECASLHKRYNRRRIIDDRVVCVRPEQETNTCVPDDGGDLSQQVNLITETQFGVGSFTLNKCSHDLPFVYTKLSHQLLKWILNTVRE